jgi:hypothetical protein
MVALVQATLNNAIPIVTLQKPRDEPHRPVSWVLRTCPMANFSYPDDTVASVVGRGEVETSAYEALLEAKLFFLWDGFGQIPVLA